MIKQEVIVELNAESIVRKSFSLHEEIASILEQGEDEYMNLANALKEAGHHKAKEWLDENDIPTKYIHPDYSHVKFLAHNVFGNNLEFTVPYLFDVVELEKDLKEADDSMTKAECRERAEAAIKKLHDIKGHNVHFSFEETDYGLHLHAGQGDYHFGALEIIMVFGDFVDKGTARENFVLAIDCMVAMAHLTDQKAYHNLVKEDPK